jgi:hypothetical protein
VTSSGRFAIVPREVVVNAALSDRARHVFTGLALYANEHRKAWPAQETVARELGLTRRKVRVALEELEDAGWIRVERRTIPRSHGGRTKTSSIYTLFPFGRATTGQTGPPLAADPHENGQRDWPQPLTARANGLALSPHGEGQEQTSRTDHGEQKTVASSLRDDASNPCICGAPSWPQGSCYLHYSNPGSLEGATT